MKTITNRFLIVFFSVICSATVVFSQIFEEHLVADSLGWIQDITSFDLDLDGDMDILCSEWSHPLNEYRYKLFWWENTGEGEFNRHLIVEDFSITQGITPIDFDNDGDIDILLAGGEDYNMFTVLENRGDLDFELHLINANFDRYAIPYEIKAADLNGDANLDIVIAFSIMSGNGWYYGGLKIYIQTEPHTFRDSTLVDHGHHGWHNLSLIDIDRDDDLDIIAGELSVSEEGLRFGWWENDGGNFEFNPLPFVGSATVNIIDLNQDDLVDILRCGHDDGAWTNIFWLENLDNLEFERHNMPGNPQPIMRNAAVADYDLDGDLDLVISGSGLLYMENSGEEDFGSRYINESMSSLKVVVSDLNDDGRMDPVASTFNNINGNISSDIYWFENRDEQAAPFDADEIVPLDFELLSVHPNPFNSTARLTVNLPYSDDIRLVIKDVMGKEILIISSDWLIAGRHTFIWDAALQPSGIYFVNFTTPTYTQTVKVLKIR